MADIDFVRLHFSARIKLHYWTRHKHGTPTFHEIPSLSVEFSNHANKGKVKQSRNRPGVDQRVPGGLGSQISWHSARECGEVVSLTHRPPLPPGMFLVLIFTRGWVDPRAMVRSEGDMWLKNPVTPPGIDPGTVRLVAQRLNLYATPLNHANVSVYSQYVKQNFRDSLQSVLFTR
jgi:hypothetical protein